MKAGIAVAAVAAALGLAGTAQASVVAEVGGTVVYVALPGEANDVTVTNDGTTAYFTDRGAALVVAGLGCAEVTPGQVACVNASAADIELGDGDDVATATATLSVTLSGGDGNDVLRGGPADDVLRGGAGDDVLAGGPGSDVLDGQDGRDMVDYSNRLASVSISFDDVSNDGGVGEHDNVLSVELAVGGQGDDTLTGGALADVLYSGPGNDTITGGGGNDVISGGPGNDALAGQGGTDTIDGGAGRDGINALDPSPAPDNVGCGDGTDRVYGDSADAVAKDCEQVDRSGVLGFTARAAPPASDPELGKSVVLRPVSGTILITPPPVGSAPGQAQPVPALPPVPLDSERNVPIGTVVDARLGRVEMTIAVDDQGTRETGEFFTGSYQIFQKALPGSLLDLALRGGKSFALCPAGLQGPGRSARAAAVKRRRGRAGTVIRRLWSDAHGHFRTLGRFGAATVRGTEWLTEDRCDGTLVQVKRGVVAVKDLMSGRTVLVKAGAEYLVRTPTG